jgi:hypothetical protein
MARLEDFGICLLDELKSPKLPFTVTNLPTEIRILLFPKNDADYLLLSSTSLI